VPELDEIVAGLGKQLTAIERRRIQPVINGTGVLIHTNLGRAPLAADAVDLMSAVAGGYSNLELDLETGRRGSRGSYVEHALAVLCGAGAATVVNNCAAALILILRHLTAGQAKEVIISRGELVQIGGGFRIPEILETTGAVLREVGTTNRTNIGDYARAVSPATAMILKVHRSNFFMEGFVESVASRELGQLAVSRRVAFVEDLGSGAVVDTARVAGLHHEPTVQEVVRAGADLVCFSGDKLLGGPQAGVIVGNAKRVAALKRDPFFRALRCDKLVLSGLQSTVDGWMDHEVGRTGRADPSGMPWLEQARLGLEQLRERAQQIMTALQGVAAKLAIGESSGQVGGGTMPREAIPSVVLQVCPVEVTPQVLAGRLRLGTPAVVGVVSEGRFCLDLRTVLPHQDARLTEALRQALMQDEQRSF
jgi:L-seryl-tRNA(Ser) seleniumtransferase